MKKENKNLLYLINFYINRLGIKFNIKIQLLKI